MTDTPEQNNHKPQISELEFEQRRLQAAVAARKAVLVALFQEQKRLSQRIAKAHSGLREAERELARIRGQSSEKISTD